MNLPRLEILPLKDLHVHEWYDEGRMFPLLERIRQSGLFRHPPVVTSVQDGSGRYIVLDGANRTAALRSLGSPHVLAQIAGQDDPGLRLRTWNHALLDADLTELLAALRSIHDLDLVSSDEPIIQLPTRHAVSVALLQAASGQVFALNAPAADLAERISALNRVVNCYRPRVHLDRTSFSEVTWLKPVYPNLTALVIFPKFSIPELVSLASDGCLLPAGITRTTLAPRALFVNFPLDVLLGDQSLEAKNAYLQTMLQERLAQQRVIYCPEPSYVFDE